jgi:hypothetical protein
MRRCAVDAATQHVESADAPGEVTQSNGQKGRAAGNVRWLIRSHLQRGCGPVHVEIIPGDQLGTRARYPRMTCRQRGRTLLLSVRPDGKKDRCRDV